MSPQPATKQTFTFEEAKAAVARLDAGVTRTGSTLDAFPKGPMGLTPDAVRATPEWKKAKQEFDAAFADLRKFNAMFAKIFAKELRAERNTRRHGRQGGV